MREATCHPAKKYCAKGLCKPCYMKIWNKKNVEALGGWPKRTPEKRQEHKLRNRYGMTIEEYKNRLVEQNGVCAICRKTCINGRLSVDHSHSSGKIRSLLCRKCNAGIGLFNDDPDLIKKALEYLCKD